MLTRLHIRNYGIIAEVDIRFADQLTIITGETGAGKSILLGALGLLLGRRADTKVLFNAEEKCVVEGFFRVTGLDLEAFFHENDLDYADECLIRREINTSGKSRAFINDTPVTLDVLRDLSAQLVELHQQFDTLDLNRESFQLTLLDALAGQLPQKEAYRDEYQQYSQLKTKLGRLKNALQQQRNEQDYLAFQLEELEKAGFQAGEQEALEQEQEVLSRTEEIQRVLNALDQAVSSGEFPVEDVLSQLVGDMSRLRNIHPGMEEIAMRLDALYAEIKDISNDASRLADQMESDPARLQEVDERLALLFRLMQKHQAADLEELLSIQAGFEEKLARFSEDTVEIERLEAAIRSHEDSLTKKAEALTAQRKKASPVLSERVQTLLNEMSMPYAILQIDIRPTGVLGPDGQDQVAYLFTANKGAAPKPLKDVASGGELSRLALSLKSVVAGALALPTLIFDEIDTGISGNVSLKMGAIIHQLARKHQVICITHSPQIASRADLHFYVHKNDVGSHTTTEIRELHPDERRYELAKMLSGDPPTDAALQNAEELLRL